ncbi:hypothetical protein [Paenibacillus sanguinis]|uniref:hypothetical protein n=1 Tax=Paenibacillus sanguinis TaxID=225906 RepID=UPI00036EA5AB|nr:hypothetical protein [Paenibacillus sanguinis]
MQRSIREILEQYMVEEELSISRFSQISTINTGTLSRILKGLKPISLGQLQLITNAMKLPQDGLYEEYIEECFASSSNLRRIRPFILRCAELERLDCIEEVVGRLLEDRQYNTALFAIAEQLFKQEKVKAAALIYRQVAESERYQHSERLALCRYRLFSLQLGEDLEENLLAATQFEPYTNRLPEMEQLEALKQLMHIFGMVHKWPKVEALAVQLQQLASSLYHLHGGSCRKEESLIQTAQPLYYYILYAYLARATAHEQYGDYNKALEFVTLYANGANWIREKDEIAERIISQFKEWATANTYLYKVLSGHEEALTEYAKYIETRPDEIFVGLTHIIKAANQYNYNIDPILERFAPYLPSSTMVNANYGMYNETVMAEKTVQFFCDLAAYRGKKNPKAALNLVLEALQLSVRISSVRNIINSVVLFQEYSDHAGNQEKQRFTQLKTAFLDESNMI